MYNQNSGYGQELLNRVAAQLPVFGRLAILKSSSDTADYNYQTLQEVFPSDPEGRVRFFTSIADAYAWMQSNNNDVLLVDGHTTHTISEMLTVAKNRVHFLGMDGGDHIMSPRAKLQMGVTGVATDLAPVLNTGVGNSFRNLKVINASTTNQSLYGFIDNGEATVIRNCHTLKVAGLDDANHAHFWMASDSSSYENLTCGQSNIPNTAAGFGILIDGKTGGATDGTVKENYGKNIIVNMSVGGSVQATSSLIKIADTAALNFANIFDNFTGTNFIPSGGTIMTDAILAPASIVAGTLFLIDPCLAGSTGVIDNASAGVKIVSRGVAPVAAGGLSTNVTD